MSVVENAQTWLGEKWASLQGDEYQEAFKIMKDWNQLKNDMYEGRLINDFGISGGSDNFCRIGAGIEIGQKAAKLRAAGKKEEADKLIESCYKLSSLREAADTVRKTIAGGSNKDADKDEENIHKGIEIGLKNPNADKWQILSKMDLATGEFKDGYNNGYADFIKKNYKMGQENQPNFTKEEGQAIGALIKSGACADLKEALAFMDKYKERAPEMVQSASFLRDASRGSLNAKEALALVEVNEEARQKNLALRDEMKKDNQLASTRITAAKSAETVRGTQAKKKSKKETLPNFISTPWQEKPKTDPKTVDWTKPQFMQDGGGR